MNTEGLIKIPTPKETADRIITTTGALHGISYDRLLTPCKKHRDVPLRHAVWLDLHCEHGWSTCVLERRLKRNHATIIYGMRRAAHARWGLPVTASLADMRAAYYASQVQQVAA